MWFTFLVNFFRTCDRKFTAKLLRGSTVFICGVSKILHLKKELSFFLCNKFQCVAFKRNIITKFILITTHHQHHPALQLGAKITINSETGITGCVRHGCIHTHMQPQQDKWHHQITILSYCRYKKRAGWVCAYKKQMSCEAVMLPLAPRTLQTPLQKVELSCWKVRPLKTGGWNHTVKSILEALLWSHWNLWLVATVNLQIIMPVMLLWLIPEQTGRTLLRIVKYWPLIGRKFYPQTETLQAS